MTVVIGVYALFLLALLCALWWMHHRAEQQIARLKDDATDLLEALDAGYAPTDARFAFAVRRLQRSVKAGKR